MVEKTLVRKSPKLGSARRFGPRYGRTIKHTYAEIEKVHRSKHKCPYCSKVAVRRISVGIWKCGKCSSKFTGKAYIPSGELIKKDEAA